VNPPAPINDLHIYPSTGLVFLANETSLMTAYYIPDLGPSPRWSRFLDNMTEEMEEDQTTSIYEDYKFVDRAELRTFVYFFLSFFLTSCVLNKKFPAFHSLGLDHLIGTPTLKPYMHGFFVDLRLYTKARAIANPFAYAEHRERAIAARLEKERESRIRGTVARAKQSSDKVKVNQGLVERIKERGEKERKKEERRKAKTTTVEGAGTDGTQPQPPAAVESLLSDPRFSQVFNDPEFQVDEASREFSLVNPSAYAQAQVSFSIHP
jgi:ribosome biogenesis protein ENP2